MISNLLKFVNTKGSSLSLPAHGRAGARATSSLAAHFAKRNTKFGGGGKARAGKNSFPPTPFLFARPRGKVFCSAALRVAIKIQSQDFHQKKFGFRSVFGAKLYVASLLPRRFAPRQADCIVFAKIFWVQSPPFAKAKRGSSQSF